MAEKYIQLHGPSNSVDASDSNDLFPITLFGAVKSSTTAGAQNLAQALASISTSLSSISSSLDNKVSKGSNGTYVYGHRNSSETTFKISSTPTSNAVPLYDSNKQLLVGDPSSASGAVGFNFMVDHLQKRQFQLHPCGWFIDKSTFVTNRQENDLKFLNDPAPVISPYTIGGSDNRIFNGCELRPNLGTKVRISTNNNKIWLSENQRIKMTIWAYLTSDITPTAILWIETDTASAGATLTTYRIRFINDGNNPESGSGTDKWISADVEKGKVVEISFYLDYKDTAQFIRDTGCTYDLTYRGGDDGRIYIIGCKMEGVAHEVIKEVLYTNSSTSGPNSNTSINLASSIPLMQYDYFILDYPSYGKIVAYSQDSFLTGGGLISRQIGSIYLVHFESSFTTDSNSTSASITIYNNRVCAYGTTTYNTPKLKTITGIKL